MNKETLKYVLTQTMARPLPQTMRRALELPLDSGKVVTLVGIRRSGKTYLLFAAMQRLESQGVDRRRLLYLNFEDDRLLPIQTGEPDLILRAHEELYPEVAGQHKWLFFDEVQNVPDRETYLRRLHDSEDVSLFVTGSSSSLLSRELATGLRGRSIAYEVFPLSFGEFLAFRGLQHEPYSMISESRMAAALEEYLQTGGLPEVVLADESIRPRILKEYLDLVFYKDLIERYGVGNPLVMRLLIRHCLGHPATLFNVHKLYQDFRSRGIGLSKDTLYSYLGYLEKSYVLFSLPVADRSLRKQAVNPKKIHPVDWALAYPLVMEPTLDVGRRLETAVFLHWRRIREDLAYLGGDHEVDVVVNPDAPEHMVNVAFSMSSPETWAREIKALEWAATVIPQVPRTLVAHEPGSLQPPAGIRVTPAWQYLLSHP